MTKNGHYIDGKTFKDFKDNFDILVNVLNHNMTELQVDVRWIKRIIIFASGIVGTIMVTAFCFWVSNN